MGLKTPTSWLKSRCERAARRFARDRSGATAVEFALVALPLFFMLFSILELAMVFILSASLDNATNDVARTIRTGQAQTSAQTQTGLRDAICSRLGWLANSCSTNLSVDVRTFAAFTNPNIPSPVNNGAFDQGQLMFQMGAQGDIVLVRAFYRWTLLTPFLNGGLSRLNGGVTMLTATATFRNEPF